MIMDKVQEFLESIGFGQYVQTFEDQGWDDIDVVLSMSESDIKTCIQKPGHVKKLLLWLEKKREKNSLSGDLQKVDNAVSVEDLSKADDTTSHGSLTQKKRSVSDETSCLEDVVSKQDDKNEVFSGALSTAPQDISYFSTEEDNLGNVNCENKESATPQTANNYDSSVACFEENAERDEECEHSSTHDRRTIGREELSKIIATVQETCMQTKIPNQVTVIDSKNVTVAENVEIHKIRRENVYGRNFKAQILSYLNDIEEKHNNLFVNTVAVKEINYVLEDRFSVLILGNSGEGKSMISDHLMLAYNKKNYEPLIITSADDWKSLVIGGKNKSKKQFVKVDDIFGISSADERKLHEWLPLFKMIGEMVHARKGYLKVVFTSRKLIYSEIEDKISSFKCFEKMRTIDLTDKRFALSKDEKGEMIKKYVSHYDIGLDDNEICTILENKSTHGFPHCVEMFCTIQSLRKNGVSFFENPINILEKEILNLQRSDKVKFSALVLVLVSDIQKHEFSIYEDNKNYSKLLDVTKKLVNLPTLAMEDIFHVIGLMQNVYLEVSDNDVYQFRHNSFYETVSFVLVKTNPVPAVKYLDIDFIVNRTKLQGYKEEPFEDIVILPQSCNKHLVERFTIGIQNYETKVFEHHAWKEEKFIHLWFDYVASYECEMSLDDIAQIDFDNDNIVSLLAANAHEMAVLSILWSAKLKTHWQTSKGTRQLSVALLRASGADCSSNLLQHLIKFGADIDYVGDGSISALNIQNPLLLAVNNCNIENTLLLLNNGASLIFPDGSNIVSVAFNSPNPDHLSHILYHIDNGIWHKLNIYDDGKLKKQNYLYGENYTNLFLKCIKPTSSVLLCLKNNKENIIQLLRMGTKVSNELLVALIWIGFDDEKFLCKLLSCNAEFGKRWDKIIPLLSEKRIDNNTLAVLAKHGLKMNMVDCKGKTVLHHLVRIQDDKQEGMISDTQEKTPCQKVTLAYLLNLADDVNVQDTKGALAVFYGVQQMCCETPSSIDALDTLIERSDVDKISDLKGRNCFHYLAISKKKYKNDHLDRIIRHLLRKNCDINQTDCYGLVPLVYCTSEMMKQFIHMGADPIGLDSGQSNIMKMIENKVSEILEKISILKETNVCMTIVDTNERNILHYVAESAYCDADKEQLFQMFEEVNINGKDLKGITPLMILVRNKSCTRRITAFCIDHGCSVEDKDNCNLSVLDHCIQGRMKKSQKLAVITLVFETSSDIYVSEESIAYTLRNSSNCEQIIIHILDQEVFDLDRIYHILKDMILSGERLNLNCVTNILFEKFGMSMIILLLSDKEMQGTILASLDSNIVLKCRHYLRIWFSDGFDMESLPQTDEETKNLLRSLLIVGVNPKNVLRNANNDTPEIILLEFEFLNSLIYLIEKRNTFILREEKMKYTLENLAVCAARDLLVLEILRLLFQSATNRRTFCKMIHRQLILWCKQDILKPSCIRFLIQVGNANNVRKTEKLAQYLVQRLNVGILKDTDVRNIYMVLQTKRCKFDVPDEMGNTPVMNLLSICLQQKALSKRVLHELEKLVHLLISESRTLGHKNSLGRNLLHYLAECPLSDESKCKFIETVAERGVQFVTDYTGKSPIRYLLEFSLKHGTYTGYVKTLQSLTEYSNDEKHILPLLISAIPSVSLNPSSEDLFIQVFQSTDLNPDVDTDICGSTFLAQSARFFSRKLVLYFLQNGADPNNTDILGYTALHRVLFSPVLSRLAYYKSAFFGQNLKSEMEYQLRSKMPWEIEKYDIEVLKEKERTLHGDSLGKLNDGLFIVHQLLRYDANPNMMDAFGRTPLHYCAESPVFDGFTCPAIQLLLAYGADVNSEDFEGRTPIMLCAQTERTKFRRMNILINAGANLFTKDYNGNSIHDFVRFGIQKRMSSIYRKDVLQMNGPMIVA